MSLPPSYNLLSQYPNRVYIETGVYRADSIVAAQQAGFQHICGIDIDPSCIEFAKKRLGNDHGIPFLFLFTGDSAIILRDLIKMIPADQCITFFLDSHWQMFEGTDPGPHPFPLIDELKQIEQTRKNKKDTIIIDDMLIMQDDIVGYDQWAIKEMLYRINPDFKIKTVANPIINNILIATV